MVAYKDSMFWSELAELTHKTQVEIFNWCSCEDNDGKENPFKDCPKQEGNTMATLTHRTIEFYWNSDPKKELEQADVVVGDGTVEFSGDYEFDERIFFYFHDEAELDLAKQGKADGVEFTVTQVIE